MILGVFTFLPAVDEQKLFALIQPGLHRVNVGLPHAGLGVVHNLQKSGRMLVGHPNSFLRRCDNFARATRSRAVATTYYQASCGCDTSKCIGLASASISIFD